MAAHQYEQGPRPEHVANWSADTLDLGYTDGMGLAMRVLGEAIGMLAGGQPNGRRVPLEETADIFGLDSKATVPVIGE
jgi:hypothetical protein